MITENSQNCLNKRKCVSFDNFVKKLTKSCTQVCNNCGFKESINRAIIM